MPLKAFKGNADENVPVEVPFTIDGARSRAHTSPTRQTLDSKHFYGGSEMLFGTELYAGRKIYSGGGPPNMKITLTQKMNSLWTRCSCTNKTMRVDYALQKCISELRIKINVVNIKIHL